MGLRPPGRDGAHVSVSEINLEFGSGKGSPGGYEGDASEPDCRMAVQSAPWCAFARKDRGMGSRVAWHGGRGERGQT